MKRFSLRQDQTAMKVGTDGVLLGAWARGGRRILDIGTGTGLIALMMAQRFEEAHVVGIDIDAAAAQQARDNVARSPFADRIEIWNISVQDYAQRCLKEGLRFDAIVCNPPYYDYSGGATKARTIARSTSALSFKDLIEASVSLMDGPRSRLSLIIPVEAAPRMEEEAALCMLRQARICQVWTKAGWAATEGGLLMRSPYKTERNVRSPYEGARPKRILMELCLEPEGFERQHVVIGSPGYKELTRDFYLAGGASSG